MPTAPMRLLLVEDDDDIARELLLRMRSRGWEPEHADRLEAADAALLRHMPDLVVLDLGLPDGDGLDWLRRLRTHEPQLPVLVLTARDRVAERVEGLQAGADDYLVKPFAVEELDARLDVMLRRSRRDRGEVVSVGTLMWFGQQGEVRADGQLLELHPREFEVLGMLMGRSPRLLPKRVLVDALAERNLDVSDAAAEVYISRLRRKLVGSGCSIQTLRGFGYRLVRDADLGGAHEAQP